LTHDIAFVIADLGCGGAQRVLTTLANALAKRQRRICVITLATPEGDFFTLDPGITRIAIGGISRSGSITGSIAANLRRLFLLRRAFRKAQPDAIVAFIASTNVLAIIAAAGLNTQVVISERNDPRLQSHGRAWNMLCRLLYRRADLVTANSHGALAALSAFVPDAKLFFAPNPIQDPGAAAAISPQSNGGEPKFLIVGRLNHQKAHDVLLDAFAQSLKAIPTWRLSIVGGGKLETILKQQANRLGISDRVDWVGEAKDPFAYYADAACFLLPSRFEGTPNALLEAMGCGLPAIVSDASPGPLEYVEDGVTGLVVPVDNASALAAAMIRLAKDPALRRQLGEAAKKRIAAHDPDQIIKTWEMLLQLSPVETAMHT
jgi:GalNAc-alpha-(1->4)-GalNAc-alpha-(1->3)-diNAcBac-PP-undecaprenol alpha-1,4-N-acetyl-D-galactosaminyltransferase